MVFEPVTGEVATPAGELEMFRSLRAEEVLSYQGRFRLGPPPIVTALLVGIQLRIWWFTWLPEFQIDVVERFTVSGPPILENGEVWRLFSAGLLHSAGPAHFVDILQTNWEHIGANMLWLAYTGWNLERALGRANLLLLFFGSVFGGALCSMTFAPEAPSLGASGGVFGLVAASIVFGLTRPELLPRRGRALFGLALLPYIVLMLWSGASNEVVDNNAHVGGMLTGLFLAFLVEPDTLQRRPGNNLRVQGAVAALMAVVLAGLAIWGPQLTWFRDSEAQRAVITRRRSGRPPPPAKADRYEPLHWSVPAGWKPGVDAVNGSAFASSSHDEDVRTWSVRATARSEVVTNDQLAQGWIRKVEERFPNAKVSNPQPATVAERSGVEVVATVPGELPLQLQWRGTARGVWVLEEVWQVDVASQGRLQPLRDRLRASVHWDEPAELRSARLDVEGMPSSPKRRNAYAHALARSGNLEESLRLHDELVRERGEQSLWISALKSIEVGIGQLDPDTLESWWDRALQEPHPSVVDHVARGLIAAEREPDARGLLELAWRNRPGDRVLNKARRRIGLSTALDEATSLPWSAVYDPVTGTRRATPLAGEPLSVGSAVEAGRQHADERAAVLAAVEAGLQAADPQVLAPLLVLRQGHVVELDDDLRKTLRDELQRAAEGRRPRWMPTDIAAVVEANPRVVDLFGS